jgi:hypothetical protein
MPESPRSHHKGRPRAQKVGGDTSRLEPIRKRPPRPQADAEVPLVRWADRADTGATVRFGADRVPVLTQPQCVRKRGHRGDHQYRQSGVKVKLPKRRCGHRKEP